MTELEKASEAWLVANDWDYKKYGDRRPNRSAYDGLMNYEISPLLAWAFEEGAKWARDEEHFRQTGVRPATTQQEREKDG